MKVIPLVPVPSQQLNITLANQAVGLNIYQKSTGVFIDVFLNNQPVRTTIQCLNEAELVDGAAYTGLLGNFMFVDVQGEQDPDYTGFGPEGTGRFQLVYLEAGIDV